MASYTKTVQSELLAITNIAAAAQQKSSELTVNSNMEATFFIDFAPQATNTPGTEIRIEEAGASSGDSIWTPIWSVITSKSALNSSAVDSTQAAGSTTISEGSTTGLAVGQYVFFKNTTLGNSEWAKIVSVSGSSNFVILDGLTNAQTGSTWYNMAERFIASINVASGKRYRVVINNNYGSSSVSVNARVACITADSFA